MRTIKIISIVLAILFIVLGFIAAKNSDIKGVLLNIIIAGLWISFYKLVNNKQSKQI